MYRRTSSTVSSSLCLYKRMAFPPVCAVGVCHREMCVTYASEEHIGPELTSFCSLLLETLIGITARKTTIGCTSERKRDIPVVMHVSGSRLTTHKDKFVHVVELCSTQRVFVEHLVGRGRLIGPMWGTTAARQTSSCTLQLIECILLLPVCRIPSSGSQWSLSC